MIIAGMVRYSVGDFSVLITVLFIKNLYSDKKSDIIKSEEILYRSCLYELQNKKD